MRPNPSWYLAFALVLAPLTARGADAESRALSVEAWRADLAHLVTTLETVHPDLYARVDRATFAARTEELERDIPRLADQEIVLRMMQLVALVEDGHTSLELSRDLGFGSWFPVRFYRFTDGVFVTAVAEPWADLAGARVVRLGGMPVEQAWRLTAALLGADNAFGALHRAPLHLSNAAVLHRLGVIPAPDRLRLEVIGEQGELEVVEITPVEADYDLSFQFWGEIWGPASDEVTYVTPFGASDDHYDESSDLPLHLRYRSAYWSTHLEEQRLLYAQINFMGNSSRREETFSEFTDALWKSIDSLDVEHLVLDLRYNIGGDGSLVLPFVHEIIKRDAINRKGALFAIVGRATFSAGVMLARALEEHTAVTFVGEPPGAYWKHYGDGTSFELPASGLEVWVSTIYHQLSSYAGDRRALGIELPAPFSSEEYLSGADPAIEEILGAHQRPLLANVFRDKGGAAGVAAYEARLAEYDGVDWWEPFSLAALNRLGHELLDAGRYEDALAAYRLNARRHPGHWRVWHSLARAQKRHGDVAGAIENYEKALAADPFNNLAPYQREALAELREGAAPSP